MTAYIRCARNNHDEHKNQLLNTISMKQMPTPLLFAKCALLFALQNTCVASDSKNSFDLIGKKVKIKSSGGTLDIPETTILQAKVTGIRPERGGELVVELFFDKRGNPAFSVLNDKGPSEGATVIDVQLIPKKYYQLQHINNGKFKKKNNYAKLYQASMECISTNTEENMIVGLVRALPGSNSFYEHKSSEVIRAWKINSNDGKMTAISTVGIECIYH